jgi:hypothetical protein
MAGQGSPGHGTCGSNLCFRNRLQLVGGSGKHLIATPGWWSMARRLDLERCDGRNIHKKFRARRESAPRTCWAGQPGSLARGRPCRCRSQQNASVSIVEWLSQRLSWFESRGFLDWSTLWNRPRRTRWRSWVESEVSCGRTPRPIGLPGEQRGKGLIFKPEPFFAGRIHVEIAYRQSSANRFARLGDALAAWGNTALTAAPIRLSEINPRS